MKLSQGPFPSTSKQGKKRNLYDDYKDWKIMKWKDPWKYHKYTDHYHKSYSYYKKKKMKFTFEKKFRPIFCSIMIFPFEEGKRRKSYQSELKLAEDSNKKQGYHIENAHIENNVHKYQNSDTLQRERRYHERRNKTQVLRSTSPVPDTKEKAEIPLQVNETPAGDHGDSFSILSVNAKLRAFEERQNNSFQKSSPPHFTKCKSPCSQGGEKFQEVQKVRTEIKKISSGLYVKLPPVDQCDSNFKQQINTIEKRPFNKESKQYENIENINNNKSNEDEKEDYPCIVDCLYYSMQCWDCSIM